MLFICAFSYFDPSVQMFVYFTDIFKDPNLITSSVIPLFCLLLIPGSFFMISYFFLDLLCCMYNILNLLLNPLIFPQSPTACFYGYDF